MTVNFNLSKIISFITSRGFQIHPDALLLIENIRGEIFQIVEEILIGKRDRNEPKIISSEDIRNALNLPKQSTCTKNDNINNDTISPDNFDYDNRANIERVSEKTAVELITNNTTGLEINRYSNHVIYDSQVQP